MRFIIVSQHFYPDTFRISDIAFALREQGHRVQVITGLPDYDRGKLPPKYRFFRNRRETHRGVEILRVPTTLRRTGSFWRLVNYASFVVSGWLAACCLRRGAEPVDAVLTYETSPVSQAIPAIRLAHRFRCPHLLYCLDLWPECVKVWGVKEGTPLFRAVAAVSRRVYNAADLVPVSSRPFARYLAEVNGVPPARIRYLPQPCEDIFEQLAGQYEENGTVDFLFAGNVGSAQDIPCMLQAVARIKHLPGFHVHIVGGGSELEAMRALCGQLGAGERVTFYGRKPLEEMPPFYRLADAFLLTLRGGDFVGQTLPGKLQSYLSAGKPIVAAIDGAAAEVMAEADCGPCVPASDVEGLARGMAAMIQNFEAFRACGERGLAYYRENFRKDVFLTRLYALVNEAKGETTDV